MYITQVFWRNGDITTNVTGHQPVVSCEETATDCGALQGAVEQRKPIVVLGDANIL